MEVICSVHPKIPGAEQTFSNLLDFVIRSEEIISTDLCLVQIAESYSLSTDDRLFEHREEKLPLVYDVFQPPLYLCPFPLVFASDQQAEEQVRRGRLCHLLHIVIDLMMRALQS